MTYGTDTLRLTEAMGTGRFECGERVVRTVHGRRVLDGYGMTWDSLAPDSLSITQWSGMDGISMLPAGSGDTLRGMALAMGGEGFMTRAPDTMRVELWRVPCPPLPRVPGPPHLARGLSSVAIRTHLDSLVVGDSVRIRVVALARDGHTHAARVQWLSSDTTVLVALDSGAVVARSVGEATLLARTAESTDSVRLRVVPRRFTAVSAGGGASCGLATDGVVWCWGGDSAEVTDPVRRMRPVLSDERFATVTAGMSHACGIMVDGAVACWWTAPPTFRWSHTTDRLTPLLQARRVPTSLRFQTVSTGDGMTCGIAPDRRAYCWAGYDPDDVAGETAGGSCSRAPSFAEGASRPCSSDPVAVEGPYRFRTVSVGESSACGITEVWTLVCWGTLGHRGATHEVPVLVDRQHSFRFVSATDEPCGLTVDGLAYCSSSSPAPQSMVTGDSVVGLVRELLLDPHLRFRALTGGANDGCGVDESGHSFCWDSRTKGCWAQRRMPRRHAPSRCTDRCSACRTRRAYKRRIVL